jgi:hypothetical protein
MIAPKDESRDLVLQWLAHKGLGGQIEMSPRSDTVIVKASIAQIEKLLHAEYSPFGTNTILLGGPGIMHPLLYNQIQRHMLMLYSTKQIR